MLARWHFKNSFWILLFECPGSVFLMAGGRLMARTGSRRGHRSWRSAVIDCRRQNPLIRKILIALPIIMLGVAIANAGPFEWTLALRPSDVVAGASLQKLRTSHHWKWEFDDQGKFEVAVRKSAFPAPAPQCRMDYLILGMPLYYPENPNRPRCSNAGRSMTPSLPCSRAGRAPCRLMSSRCNTRGRGARVRS